MSETTVIVNTLKKLLRKQGLTYFDVAERLNLSEASIKIMLSKNKVSLDRLDKICEMLGMEISDLIDELNHEQRTLQHLTYEQELEIVSDLRLLVVAIAVLSDISFDEIIGKYKISDQDCRNYFRRLEQVKFIRLLPDNRYKLNIRKNFSWLNNGPIQKYFHDHLQQEFFSSSFDQKFENLKVSTRNSRILLWLREFYLKTQVQ
jgi:DNA-binding Xre family transcriptional regulator